MLSPQNHKQRESLTRLRELLKGVTHPEPDTDHYLMRWLIARDFNVQKVHKMILTHYEWRLENKVDFILQNYKAPEVLRLYEPGGYCGKDRDGYPLWYYPIGTADLKGIMHSCTRQDILRRRIWQGEHLLKEFLPKFRQKTGNEVYHTNILMDMEHASVKKFMSWSIIELQKELSRLAELNFPETLRRMYIVNAPSFFPMFFNLMKPMMQEDTIKKIHIFGTNFKDDLLKYIDPAELPVKYGGTLVDSRGDPNCSEYINYGGKVPESFYLRIGNNFKCDQVGRGSKLQFDFNVYEKDVPRRLEWEFETQDYDIDFGVFKKTDKKHTKDMEVIVPMNLCFSNQACERGSCILETPGTYIAVFDNSSSWTRNKKIRYRIELKNVNETEEDVRLTTNEEYFSTENIVSILENENNNIVKVKEKDVEKFFCPCNVDQEGLWFSPQLAKNQISHTCEMHSLSTSYKDDDLQSVNSFYSALSIDLQTE